MSREEDHKTLQEEYKDAKVAFLRRRKIDRQRRVHESAAERQERLKGDRKRVFAKLSQESGEEREKLLKVLRDNNASRRAVETTEQREKRLGTQRKQAALKRASETGQERERRLRAMREVAAKKRATESSQEKELRLRARRVSATARTGRKQSRLAEETKHERRPTIADGTSERLSLKDTAANICTTADGQILKIAVYITKSGPRRRWQPSIASRKTCATIIVSFAKKHGRRLLPDSRYFLAPDASETESRVDYILLRTTWILEASQQNYKASVKSRNCWLHERSP